MPTYMTEDQMKWLDDGRVQPGIPEWQRSPQPTSSANPLGFPWALLSFEQRNAVIEERDLWTDLMRQNLYPTAVEAKI